MRYVFYVLMLFAMIALALLLFFKNVRLMIYNLFHTKKKFVDWSMTSYVYPDEDFYHK